MALTGPILDDRSYAQLRDELVRRIPVYAPEWTDHNESDPGIALIELFAYLGESILFRFNQIPDATKVAFLRLLGVRSRPSVSARALLALTTERSDGVQVLRGSAAQAGPVPFETDDEVYVWPLTATTYGKVTAPTIDPTDLHRLTEEHRREDARDALGLTAADEHTFYEPRALPDDPTTVDAEALDVRQTADHSLWIAALAEATTDTSAMRGRTLFVGLAFDESLEPLDPLVPQGPDRIAREQADGPGQEAPAMVWELWQGPGAPTPLRALDVLGDTTHGLTTDGVVKLQVPDAFPAQQPGAESPGGRTEPPPVDDEVRARTVAWLRVRRPDGGKDSIRKVRWVGFNAVSVVQVAGAAPELLGTGTGAPGQSYRLTQGNVVGGSVRLEVEEAAGWTGWSEVDTFVESRSDDRHYTVDPVDGIVTFGARSRVPQLGERIRVTGYRYGGGSSGNVAAGAINAITSAASVKATNVLAAAGGADPASLAEALDAIPGHVQRRDRAVVAEDFAALAGAVRGVARAESLPLLHPDEPAITAAGVVSVVVFPVEDLARPGAPLPDLALLRRVSTDLEPRRLATCEVYVIPPTYRPVGLSVGVQVKPGFQVDAVRRWVDLILRQYLSPLPPYGPDGAGWPMGRTLRRAELEAVCAQVDGVEYVERELLLAEPRQVVVDGMETTAWPPVSTVALERWEVPEVVALSVVGGEPLPISAPYGPDPTNAPALVPLPPDVC